MTAGLGTGVPVEVGKGVGEACTPHAENSNPGINSKITSMKPLTMHSPIKFFTITSYIQMMVRIIRVN
jgi:hypothetical protein